MVVPAYLRHENVQERLFEGIRVTSRPRKVERHIAGPQNAGEMMSKIKSVWLQRERRWGREVAVQVCNVLSGI